MTVYDRGTPLAQGRPRGDDWTTRDLARLSQVYRRPSLALEEMSVGRVKVVLRCKQICYAGTLAKTFKAEKLPF